MMGALLTWSFLFPFDAGSLPQRRLQHFRPQCEPPYQRSSGAEFGVG